jgi:maintenance of mitochondrial morphology protein 1
MANYLFTLEPTFTQGLVLGQLSVFFLLSLILKYLFWHTGPEPQLISLPPNSSQRRSLESNYDMKSEPESNHVEEQNDSLEWLNGLLARVRIFWHTTKDSMLISYTGCSKLSCATL